MIIIASLLFFKEAKKASTITVKHSGTPLISETQAFIPIYKEDKMYGNPGAEVTVITFTDFNCKKCSQIHKELIALIDKSPSKIRLVWKGFPQTKLFSETFNIPHVASYCADLQNMFWPYVNKAMLDNNLTDGDLDKIAVDLKLNQNSFLTCKSLAVSSVATSTAIAKQFGIKKLPVVFINNYYVNTDENISITDLVKNFIKE